jgi:hypothetical protein
MQFKLSEGNNNFSAVLVTDVKSRFASNSYKKI